MAAFIYQVLILQKSI